jgi:ubiquinone/menaquinone biosynthesis C-methylase UbiE
MTTLLPVGIIQDMQRKTVVKEEEYFNTYYTQNPSAFEDSPALKKHAEIYFQKMMHVLQPKKSDSLLGLGCANGRFELRFAPLVKKITGIDISGEAIRNARQNAKKLRLTNANFCVYDITKKLPFPDSSFDHVLALGVIHHLPVNKIDALIKEIYRVLKPNGILFTIDPQANGILRILARRYFKKLYLSYRSPDEYDVDREKLKKSCQKAGFTIEKVIYLDFCASEIANFWPTMPMSIFTILLMIDRVWCVIPGLNTLSSQLSLCCRKEK